MKITKFLGICVILLAGGLLSPIAEAQWWKRAWDFLADTGENIRHWDSPTPKELKIPPAQSMYSTGESVLQNATLPNPYANENWEHVLRNPEVIEWSQNNPLLFQRGKDQSSFLYRGVEDPFTQHITVFNPNFDNVNRNVTGLDKYSGDVYSPDWIPYRSDYRTDWILYRSDYRPDWVFYKGPAFAPYSSSFMDNLEYAGLVGFRVGVRIGPRIYRGCTDEDSEYPFQVCVPDSSERGFGGQAYPTYSERLFWLQSIDEPELIGSPINFSLQPRGLGAFEPTQ